MVFVSPREGTSLWYTHRNWILSKHEQQLSFFFSRLGRSGISGKETFHLLHRFGDLGGVEGGQIKGPRWSGTSIYSYSFLLQFTYQMVPSEMALRNKHTAANTSMQRLSKTQHPFLLIPESHWWALIPGIIPILFVCDWRQNGYVIFCKLYKHILNNLINVDAN